MVVFRRDGPDKLDKIWIVFGSLSQKYCFLIVFCLASGSQTPVNFIFL